MQELYERIVEETNKLGITGKELGEKLSLKKSPLTDWKNKKSNPTLEQFEKMCEIFAIPADYLLFGKSTSATFLSPNEKEMLDLFKQLPDREQIKYIARLEDAVEKYNTKE